ncbi:MAG: HepT-like ribonuclease domain-containing protein [bacterium]
MVGHRNVIVHDYADLSSKRIWEVVENDLPGLVLDLERLSNPKMA